MSKVKPKTYLLENLTWKEAEDLFKKTDVALINTGAIHPHGLNVPLGLDSFGATEVGIRLDKVCVKRGIDIVILPTINYGITHHHGDFPGNISIDIVTMTRLYWNIIKWIHKWGIRKIIWHTPHYVVPSIEQCMYRARTELGMIGFRVAWDFLAIALTKSGVIDQPIKSFDGGLIMEGSLAAACRPEYVDFSAETFKEYLQPWQEQGSSLEVVHPHRIKFKGIEIQAYMGTRDVTPTGGYGAESQRDYSLGSEETGNLMVNAVVDYIADLVVEAKKIKLPGPDKYWGTGWSDGL